MDVQAPELGSGAWRDEEPHRSAEAGTVQEVVLACMLPGLGKAVRTSELPIRLVGTYGASDPSVAKYT
jgi:hypothetical protein